jgi:hypothetical protein
MFLLIVVMHFIVSFVLSYLVVCTFREARVEWRYSAVFFFVHKRAGGLLLLFYRSVIYALRDSCVPRRGAAASKVCARAGAPR